MSGKGVPVHIPKGKEAKKRKADFQKFNKEKDTLKEVWRAAQAGETKDKGRNWTLTVAVPGSALNNAPTVEMKSYIAGMFCLQQLKTGISDYFMSNRSDCTGSCCFLCR